MAIEKLKVLEALGTVMDPKSGKDITSMNLVSDLKIEGNNVSFTLSVTGVDSLTKSNMNFACMKAVRDVYADADVHVHISSKSPTLGTKERILPQVKNIIAVASGKGGVGKSTVATNLALGLRALGAHVGLIDADLYGPSIPTMLGLRGERPKVRDVNGKHKIVPLDGHGMPVMSIGFIVEEQQAVVLRGPRLGAIIKQFISDCMWPPLDYLIIDLPPGTGDIQLTLVQTVPLTGVVMVTTPQDVAVADAVKAMNMFLLPSVNVPILGVVENMSWFTPAELPDNKYYLFGEGGGKKIAQMSNSVLLGQVPIVQSIREGGDNGVPIVLGDESPSKEAFMEVAKSLMRQANLRNEQLAPTQKVDIKTT